MGGNVAAIVPFCDESLPFAARLHPKKAPLRTDSTQAGNALW